MNPEIVQYILEHRGTYTREAIRQHLIDAGHSPAEVDAAWEAVESSQLPPTPPGEPSYEAPVAASQDPMPARARTDASMVRAPVFWLTLVGFVVVVYLSLVLFNTIIASAVIWLGGFIAAFILARRNRPVAMGLALGATVAFLLPFVVVIILLGVCIVTGTSGL